MELIQAEKDNVANKYVKPGLAAALAVAVTFDLWMTATTVDAMSVYVYYMTAGWQIEAVCLDLISCAAADGRTLGTQLYRLLARYGVQEKVVAYVTDGGSNLRTATHELSNQQVGAKTFGMTTPFHGDCYAHHLNNAGNQATRAESSPAGLDMPAVRRSFQAMTTYTRKSAAGWGKWLLACAQAKLPAKKICAVVKTRFSSLYMHVKQVYLPSHIKCK